MLTRTYRNTAKFVLQTGKKAKKRCRQTELLPLNIWRITRI